MSGWWQWMGGCLGYCHTRCAVSHPTILADTTVLKPRMPAFKIKVKWGKEIFQDVEVDTDEEPIVFKAQLMALTGVQVPRKGRGEHQCN